MAGKRLTKKQKLDAITGSGGLLCDIAAKAGVHRATVRVWRNADPEIAQAIEGEREGVTDRAERNIVDAIKIGDLNASKYWLSTIGRDRGFSTRHEFEGTAKFDMNSQVKIYLPDNGRDGLLIESE